MLGLVLIVHIIIAAVIIALVLLQHGKGADMGASFGSGGSQTLFGSQGAAPFMMKLTGFFAALFFVSALTLGYLSSNNSDQSLQPPVVQTQKSPATESNQSNKSGSNLLDQTKDNGNKNILDQIQKQSSN